MAAQGQNFGIPGYRHFWDQTTTAYVKITELYRHGSNYEYEDVVWHTWGAICYMYFPQEAPTPVQPRWAIDREAYRGYQNNNSSTKPDLIAIKLSPGPGQLGQMPQFTSRDFLWIECKAACQDKRFGWKDVLGEAAGRLRTAHPSRTVFLIVAVGWKCMYFVWDPTNSIQQQQLFICPERPGVGGNPQRWDVDANIKAIHNAQWVNINTGAITTENAMVLDCFTTVQGTNVIANGHSLSMIEQFLVSVQNAALQGQNPLTW